VGNYYYLHVYIAAPMIGPMIVAVREQGRAEAHTLRPTTTFWEALWMPPLPSASSGWFLLLISSEHASRSSSRSCPASRLIAS